MSQFRTRNTKDDTARGNGSPKYATLIHLSTLASVADSWQVKGYTQLCNMRTGIGVHKNTTTMTCRLSRFSRFGSDLDGFVASGDGVRLVYINQRINLTFIMTTNRLARQVGLERWRDEGKAFKWDGYAEARMPVTAMKYHILRNITRLVVKAQDGDVTEVMSQNRGPPRRPAYSVTRVDARTPDLGGWRSLGGTWSKGVAEQRLLMLCKVLFEGDASGIFEMGMRTAKRVPIY